MRHSIARVRTRAGSYIVMSVFAVLAVVGSAQLATAQEDVASLIASAKEKFAPISAEQVAAAKSELQTQAWALEKYIRPQSANGKKWLTYLKWQEFQEALAGEGDPKFEPLVATYQQLNKDNPGLELKPFRAVADALQHFIDLSAMARQEDQAKTFAGQLDGLSSEIESYKSSPTANTAAAIGRRLDLLTGLGQSPDLVSAVRKEFAQPNAYVTVSSELLKKAAAKPINRRDPITDVILGTRIRGNGQTTGSVTLKTVPSDDKAIIQLDTKGRVVSQNVGHNGPAVIRSTGYTNFDAKVVVELSDNKFVAFPARVNASTSSNIHSVSKAGGGMGRRVVANVGMDKAREKQGQANRIAADHAETRIANRMSSEIDGKLAKAWKRYENDYRLPLARRGASPEFAQFSTTDNSLDYVTTQATRGQLAAPSAPPELPSADLIARLHESAINNYTAALLGGATLSESKPGEGTKADVNLPPFIKDAWRNRMDKKADDTSDAAFEAWSLTFRRDRPITAAFTDGKIALTLHIAKLVSGEDTFDRWDVTATYTPELIDGGVKLTRDGDLTVLPTGFDPEKGQLSSRQVAVRSNLTKVLTERSDQGRGIPQTINVKAIEPRDEMKHVGTLPVSTFASGNGWLTVAWNRE
jgi:hypothetical protein